MNAGQLRDRITLQRRPDTKDPGGQRSAPFADVATLTRVPSEVRDLTGRELASAQTITPEVTVSIKMRGFTSWRSQIKPDMRAVFPQPDGSTRLFDIKGITNPDGRDRELQLLCVEFVG